MYTPPMLNGTYYLRVQTDCTIAKGSTQLLHFQNIPIELKPNDIPRWILSLPLQHFVRLSSSDNGSVRGWRASVDVAAERDGFREPASQVVQVGPWVRALHAVAAAHQLHKCLFQ